MALGIRDFTQRVGDGAGEPSLDAENGEELVRVQPGVSVVLGNRPPESPGTLYISTKYPLLLSLSLICLAAEKVLKFYDFFFKYLNIF